MIIGILANSKSYIGGAPGLMKLGTGPSIFPFRDVQSRADFDPEEALVLANGGSPHLGQSGRPSNLETVV
jgi:hypothetical protein